MPDDSPRRVERIVNGVLLGLVVLAWVAFFDASIVHFPTVATRYVYPLMDHFDKKPDDKKP